MCPRPESFPITHATVKEQTAIIETWVNSKEGLDELRFDSADAKTFCTFYQRHFQLLSWTSANPHHSQQLDNAKKTNSNYIGPTPEVKRAIFRLRGLDLALSGNLGTLLCKNSDSMTLEQLKRLFRIFQDQAPAMDSIRWATVFRSTMMSPKAWNRIEETAKNEEDKKKVVSTDSVTWLHQWASQDNLLDQLTLPLNDTGVEVPIIDKKGDDIKTWLYQIRAALFQPAHFRHMIFSEAIVSGYYGIMSLSLEEKKIWFISWLVDLVAFSNDIGEYMTRTMMARALAIYDGITTKATAEEAFQFIEQQFIIIALSQIPADHECRGAILMWGLEDEQLLGRLAGQMKTKTQAQYHYLVEEMARTNDYDQGLKPWHRFYRMLNLNQALPTPTYVPQLLEQLIRIANPKTEIMSPSNKIIVFSGMILAFLLTQYEAFIQRRTPQGSSNGQKARNLIDTIKTWGPLNVDAISRDKTLLEAILSCKTCKELDLENLLTITWPEIPPAKPTATFTPPSATLAASATSPVSLDHNVMCKTT
ncbi:MAG: hypothetical protein ACHQAX_02515 [Gammaproteobacteria bacterium]